MDDNIKEEIIEIKGMHCKSCVEKIETKLSQLKGIDRVRVSLVEEKAYVHFHPEQTDLEIIKGEIENIGYETDNGKSKTNKGSIKQGIIYGLIPHIGCIAFIIGSVLGVTVLTQLFKPLLMNKYFFHILIGISFLFATISAIAYLKKQGFITSNKNRGGLELAFSPQIIKRKWKYLLTMYGSTIGVNLLLFFIIFPLLANVSISSPSVTGVFAGVVDGGSVVAGSSESSIRLKVDIPCSGHASLISGELKTITGVIGVKFSSPNIFDVKYDPTKTSKQQILSLDVFNTYKATVVDESEQNVQPQNTQSQSEQVSGGCGCGGCSSKSSGGSCCGAKVS